MFSCFSNNQLSTAVFSFVAVSLIRKNVHYDNYWRLKHVCSCINRFSSMFHDCACPETDMKQRWNRSTLKYTTCPARNLLRPLAFYNYSMQNTSNYFRPNNKQTGRNSKPSHQTNMKIGEPTMAPIRYNYQT